MSAHDRYLANYRTGTQQVWCSNPACELHGDGVEIRWESEYGQSWWDPEDCWVCHSSWLQEQPEPVDEEEEC